MPSVSRNIAHVYSQKTAVTLAMMLKGEVLLLNMSFEVFLEGSDDVSVDSQILILRKCNCNVQVSKGLGIIFLGFFSP